MINTLTFYRFMLWVAEFELAIALSTGRNKGHIAQIRADVAEFKGICDRLEVRSVGTGT